MDALLYCAGGGSSHVVDRKTILSIKSETHGRESAAADTDGGARIKYDVRFVCLGSIGFAQNYC